MDGPFGNQSMPSESEIVSQTPSQTTSAFSRDPGNTRRGRTGRPRLRDRPPALTPAVTSTQRRRYGRFTLHSTCHGCMLVTNM